MVQNLTFPVVNAVVHNIRQDDAVHIRPLFFTPLSPPTNVRESMLCEAVSCHADERHVRGLQTVATEMYGYAQGGRLLGVARFDDRRRVWRLHIFEASRPFRIRSQKDARETLRAYGAEDILVRWKGGES